MSNLHTSLVRLVSSLLVTTAMLAGCASSPPDATPDAGMAAIPLEPAGTYAIRSSYSLAAAPPAAAPILAELAAATDGPDDPSRFLIDRLVARLPDGQAQVIAAAVAPYLAAYVQARIDAYAPKLRDGLGELAGGLNQVARRFATMEDLTIGSASVDGGRVVQRRVIGLRFEPRGSSGDPYAIDVPLAPLGVGDIAAEASVTVSADRIVIGEHAMTLPYAALLRAGLDRAVVPAVVPGAHSLDEALVALVDCARLGAIVAEYVGVGMPATYERACDAALMHVAAEIYERLAATAEVRMMVAGSARVIDLDRDGPGDVIASGTWAGTVGEAPIAFSVFEGSVP